MILYQEYPPCPALAPYLDCLWTCQVLHGAAGDGLSHRVLPDNCIDILWQDDATAHVAGMMSSAIQVPITRPVRTIAVRFKPGAAAYFFALPLHQMADLHPALDQLWPAHVAARFADALWSAPLDDRQAVTVLQTLLLQHCRPAPRVALADAAVKALVGSQGRLRVDALAATLGVSRQHLSQQFRTRVGLGAKQFARVCRFQAASARIRASGANQADAAPDWARMALELGYYDQPHLIHEFRALADTTPESFIARG